MVIGKFIGWLRGAKDASPLPEELWQSTLAALPFLARLNDDERLRLRLLAEQFLAQKEFTSAGGLVLTDAMCASIAVQGCLPVLNLGLECYRDWVGVVVYPDEFVIPRSIEDEFGVVHEYDDIASGEAWEGGPLLISWQDAQMAGEGYNVVIHEFAHKLDMHDGTANGTSGYGYPVKAFQVAILPAGATPTTGEASATEYAYLVKDGQSQPGLIGEKPSAGHEEREAAPPAKALASTGDSPAFAIALGAALASGALVLASRARHRRSLS